MVIQRSWKTPAENQVNHIHASDDSNGSCNTVSSSNSSKTSNFKYVTTSDMAENFLSRIKHRFGVQTSSQKSASEAAMRSMELLRINVQNAFDNEINNVVEKFMGIYFKPAFKNIKENLGENVVSNDVLQKMSCALLENSKAQYNSRARVNITTASEFNTAKPTIINQTTHTLKRELENVASYIPQKKSAINNSTIVNNSQSRRQIFWNTANICSDTRFLLDVQANQAFGFSTDGRERLASKHPELIRYLPDGQDRDWLIDQKIIPMQNRNSRFLFLVYEEVLKLGQSDQYKNKNELNLQILHSFKVPHFIIQKMRAFFVDLNIKSRGLISNSFTTPSGGSHLRNALLQGSSFLSSNIYSANMADGSLSNSLKTRSSLSSSHATLTALLNSNNEMQNAVDNPHSKN